MKRFFSKLFVCVFLVALCTFIYSLNSYCDTIKFRIVAANPSAVKKQRVPIKIYLPEEVTQEDIVDLAGLKFEYDSEKSLYYVYKDDLILDAKKMRVFQVEVNDIWLVPLEDVDSVGKRVKYLLQALEGTDYGEQVQSLTKEFELLSSKISTSQNDDSLSRSQHIGIYRINDRHLVQLKEKVVELERILQRELGPLTPDLLTKTKFKTESPTKTATWIAIFSIIFFLLLISAIVFITWYRQGKATEKIMADAKKSSFLDFGKKDENK